MQPVWSTSAEFPGIHNPITAYSLLRSFLKLWKQLELFKEAWGRLKLRVEEVNTVPLYKQFSELYRVDILYPSLKDLARQMGKEEEFEALLTSTQTILPPKGASEVDIRTRQLQRILEALETHMIHEVHRKISKDITMVISERAREDRGLPTELWKHPVMKENFSATRPHILEQFIQRLMKNCQDTDTEFTFSKEHLEGCLTSLGCDLMERERSNFETYSMFYENVLQQEHQLLYQKEQEIQAIGSREEQAEGNISQTAELSQELVMEVTALRAKLSDIEEDHFSLKERVRIEVQDEYETLVRTLFGICINLKSRLDQYHISMNKQMCELISEVRKEGVDNMIELKKKFGATKDDSTLKDNLATRKELQTLREENSRLEELLCKLKALGSWKETIKQGKLRVQLRSVEKESQLNKKDSLKVTMMVEKEMAVLRERLGAAQSALARSQAENEKVKKQLDKQKQLLTEAEHRLTQEYRSRQHLDHMKAVSIEKLLEDIGDKEQRLQSLTEEAEKSSKISHLQQTKVKKEIKQIRGQLSQERSLKLDAFQRVDELQTQVYDLEIATPQRNSSAGVRRKSPSLSSFSPGSVRTHSAGSALWPAFPAHSTPSVLREYAQYSSPSELRGSAVMEGGTEGRIQRPKTVPSRCRNRMAALPETTHHTILSRLQDLRLNIR
ncbi:coiled-coil domain-containing protein 162-like [Ambystoma mexicanum]|uniref:coiled-coil domain-containing protein 162-like n=1 Tax=Ambystoma mexicanum TaxID=8296 RepID=UPI0037E73944